MPIWVYRIAYNIARKYSVYQGCQKMKGEKKKKYEESPRWRGKQSELGVEKSIVINSSIKIR